MKQILKDKIKVAVEAVYSKIQMPDFSLDYPDEKFGDFSTNVAMILAKTVGESPQVVAQKIIDHLGQDENLESTSVTGPGFINFKIALPYYQKQIFKVIEAGDRYGANDIGQAKKIDVEFISANPTGPLTVGNSRGGCIGDVLANVLTKAGWQVTREYYFNDAGGQIDVLGHSVLKDDQLEYKGDYIDKLHDEIKTTDYREAGKEAAQIMIKEIKQTTKKMGINFDVWFAEGRDLREKGKVDEIIDWLKQKDLLYQNEGAWWFKSTQFGDDKDRVVVRSNGEPTYFALDCAYHKNKFEERKFDFAVNVWGADHHGDLARLKGFVKALGYENKFDILMHQFVRIVQDGHEVRMSKRTGNYITVDELLDEVGKDAYRFFMLEYAPDSHLTFDLQLAKERSQKNPVFYVQYANARISSILAKLNLPAGGSDIKIDESLLKQPEEIALIKELIKLSQIVSEIAQDYQVQKLPNYAKKLAESFHHFYEKCPIVQSGDDNLTASRTQLLLATKIVFKNTLDLMGISAPEKM